MCQLLIDEATGGLKTGRLAASARPGVLKKTPGVDTTVSISLVSSDRQLRYDVGPSENVSQITLRRNPSPPQKKYVLSEGKKIGNRTFFVSSAKTKSETRKNVVTRARRVLWGWREVGHVLPSQDASMMLVCSCGARNVAMAQRRSRRATYSQTLAKTLLLETGQ